MLRAVLRNDEQINSHMARADLLTFSFSNFAPFLVMTPNGELVMTESFEQLGGFESEIYF